jgi:rubrerythrin
LEDVIACLTKGRPTELEIGVTLCLLHRGLDRSTFADRFNFEAWSQLVKYFKSADPKQWDLKLCPVPIELERMKTDFEHYGFLEHDAVDAIINYVVNVRIPKFGIIKQNEPIFLTTKGHAITDGWISKMINKLAERAKVQKKISGYELCNRNEKTPHELRDTLDSIMTKCNSAFFAVEQSLGHVPKSGYEKTAIMFQEDIRKEYAKSANKLNIFTKISRAVSGKDDSDELKAQLKERLSELEEIKERRLDDEAEKLRNQRIFAEQQRQIDILQKTVEEIKTKKKKLEFCCAGCSIIHCEESCPNCGSKIRRIYDAR